MPPQITFSQDDLERLITGTHWDPRAILGPHVATIDQVSCLIIRAWLPYAVTARWCSNRPPLKMPYLRRRQSRHHPDK